MCAPFSAPPRLFKRKCQSPLEHAYMNPHGVRERPQKNVEYAYLCATLLNDELFAWAERSTSARIAW